MRQETGYTLGLRHQPIVDQRIGQLDKLAVGVQRPAEIPRIQRRPADGLQGLSNMKGSAALAPADQRFLAVADRSSQVALSQRDNPQMV